LGRIGVWRLMKLLFENWQYMCILLCLIAVGCGTQHVQDPNIHTTIASADCVNLSKGECAIALYNDSKRFVIQGEVFVCKKMYMSAKLEYMKALYRLEASKIRLEEAKLNTYQDYQIVVQSKLKEKVEERIRFCEKRINFVKWR